jgi:hypothetical protein
MAVIVLLEPALKLGNIGPLSSGRNSEKRGDKWSLVLRQPIYEKDRLNPLDPSAQLRLDESLVDQFPAGYRHLAYIQRGWATPSRRICRASLGPKSRRSTVAAPTGSRAAARRLGMNPTMPARFIHRTLPATIRRI